MEFHVSLDGVPADAGRLEAALLEQDPAALLDLDGRAGLLRVSTWLPAADLLAVLAASGCAVDERQLRQLPSICCGGCSG